MAKKNNTGGLVYSTSPDFHPEADMDTSEAVTPAKDKQKLRVKLDTKQRAGKVVTVVEGFTGKQEDLEVLGKELKTKCGAGGSVKDGVILIQGDYREKVVGWLKGWGYMGVKLT